MPTTTNYIWDEQNYLAESDATNIVNVVYTNEPREYGNLISSRISGTTFSHHFDALGSTRQLTNAAGTATDTMLYGAWGDIAQRTGSTAATLLWAGEAGYYFDLEIELGHVRARSYAPLLARWRASEDILFGSSNTYLYAINAPTLVTDPSGLVAIATSIRPGWTHDLCGALNVTLRTTVSRARNDPQLIAIQKIYIYGNIRMCDKDVPKDGCGPDEALCNKLVCTELLATCEFWELLTAYLTTDDKSRTADDNIQRPRVSAELDCPNTSGDMHFVHDVRVYQLTKAAALEINGWPARPTFKCHGINIKPSNVAFQGKNDPQFTHKQRSLAEGGYEAQVAWDCCRDPKLGIQTMKVRAAFGGNVKEIDNSRPGSGATIDIKRPTDGGC